MKRYRFYTKRGSWWGKRRLRAFGCAERRFGRKAHRAYRKLHQRGSLWDALGVE